MPAQPKKILFISHEASLSGAIYVLLDLMKWMKQNTQVEIAFLLKEDGPLRQKFEEICPVYLYDFQIPQSPNRPLNFIWRRILGPAFRDKHRERLLRKLNVEKFDLVYANTAGLGDILTWLSPLNMKVISHIHELQFVLDCTGPENIKKTLKETDYYIAVSDEVKENLSSNLGVKPGNIKVLPPFIDFTKVDAAKDEISPTVLKRQLEIPENSLVVCGSGSVEWRKGIDLFVQVAIQVLAKIPDAHFIWLGHFREAYIDSRLNYDIKKAGLQKNIRFMGPQRNPYPFYNIADVFVLPSREDPYPLVCLENMYLGKPVICFERSGGAVSLIKRFNAGETVGYLNSAAMADVVVNYSTGAAIKKKCDNPKQLMDDHSVNTVAPAIYDALVEFFNR